MYSLPAPWSHSMKLIMQHALCSSLCARQVGESSQIVTQSSSALRSSALVTTSTPVVGQQCLEPPLVTTSTPVVGQLSRQLSDGAITIWKQAKKIAPCSKQSLEILLLRWQHRARGSSPPSPGPLPYWLDLIHVLTAGWCTECCLFCVTASYVSLPSTCRCALVANVVSAHAHNINASNFVIRI